MNAVSMFGLLTAAVMIPVVLIAMCIRIFIDRFPLIGPEEMWKLDSDLNPDGEHGWRIRTVWITQTGCMKYNKSLKNGNVQRYDFILHVAEVEVEEIALLHKPFSIKLTRK